MPYRSYGNPAPSAYEGHFHAKISIFLFCYVSGDFSIEENMYAINIPGRLDPVSKYVYRPSPYN